MTTLKMFRNGVISSLAAICHPYGFQFVLRAPFASTLGVVHHKSSNVDALDIFTTEFLAKKRPNAPTTTARDDSPAIALEKKLSGQVFKTVTADGSNTFDLSTVPNVASWSQTVIDNYLVVSMDCGDRDTFRKIIVQLIELKRLPSDAIILRMLCYLCDDSDDSMATIFSIIDVCQETNIAFYAKNMQFAPFLSQYLWKLERFDDALNTLNTIFATTNPVAKSHILRNYRQIIYDGIKNHDEIVVDKILANAEHINAKHKDPVLITYVWSDCFFSDLFRNQRKADELFATYSGVQDEVAKNIGWISLTLLRQYNVDAVHRLIEMCIATEMNREVGICLAALFDYHCLREDLRACSEIINTNLRLGMPVSNSQNQKLINLLLKKKPKPIQKTAIIRSRFEFKF